MVSTSNEESVRKSIVEKFFAEHLVQMKIVNIETIWKGASGERVKTAMSLVELASRADREVVLKKIEEGVSFKDVGGEKLTRPRTKLASQLKRNVSMREAERKSSRIQSQQIKMSSLCG